MRTSFLGYPRIGRSLLAGFLHHIESEILEDSVVTILIRICKSCFRYWIMSQSKMVLFTSMCLKGNNHIAQTLAITQLAGHHCKQLVPTRELLYVSITIVLANVVVKLCSIQKSSYLSENVFVLIHSSRQYDCKDKKSNPFHFKNMLKRLYFKYFKDRFAHFYWTVVTGSSQYK